MRGCAAHDGWPSWWNATKTRSARPTHPRRPPLWTRQGGYSAERSGPGDQRSRNGGGTVWVPREQEDSSASRRTLEAPLATQPPITACPGGRQRAEDTGAMAASRTVRGARGPRTWRVASGRLTVIAVATRYSPRGSWPWWPRQRVTVSNDRHARLRASAAVRPARLPEAPLHARP